MSEPAKTLFQQAKESLDRKYEFRETLGTGAFSEVKKAIHRETKQPFAIKIIDRQKCVGKETMIHSEISILQKVQHENIIQLFELFETEHKIYLVMQLVTGGELFDSIVARGHYTEMDAAQIVEKILMAVNYLHEMGIAHRDLKPENLLFSCSGEGAQIMISDFGLSKIFNDEEVMKTACGTPGYVAPEVLKRQGYGREVDLWSLGVITYILLCGYPPFYDENNHELFQQIMRGEYQFDSPHWDDISREGNTILFMRRNTTKIDGVAKDFISKLLVVDPKKRYDTTRALQHAFLRKNCKERKANITAVPGVTPVRPAEASAELTPAFATPSGSGTISDCKPLPEQVDHANLAERVSNNLRTRGASVGRRRSTDAGAKRVSPYIAHPPPPPMPVVKQEPSLEEVSSPLPAKEELAKNSKAAKAFLDSGVVADIANSRETGLHSGINQPATIAKPSVTAVKSEPGRDRCSTTTSVRFLSLNLSVFPPGVKSGYYGSKDARVDHFCENIIDQYDVLALQDVYAFGSRRREQLIEKAYARGFKYWVASSSKGFQETEESTVGASKTNMDGGMLILSRFSVRKCDRLTFARGIGEDRNFAKGALYAKISLRQAGKSETYVHVFNMSLQTTDTTGNEDASAVTQVRLRQLDAFKNFMDVQLQRETDCPTVLVAGGFNFDLRDTNTDEHTHWINILTTGKVPLRAENVLSSSFGEHPITYRAPVDKKNSGTHGVESAPDSIFEMHILGSERSSPEQHDRQASLQSFALSAERPLKSTDTLDGTETDQLEEQEEEKVRGTAIFSADDSFYDNVPDSVGASAIREYIDKKKKALGAVLSSLALTEKHRGKNSVTHVSPHCGISYRVQIKK